MAATEAKISVASLQPADKEGFLTKQGGSIKTWKRRWFVLKDKKLYYFKGQKDLEVTGIIELEDESFVTEETENKKKKNMFTVGTKKRVFLISADTQEDMKVWVQGLKNALEKKQNDSQTNGNTQQINQTPSTQPQTAVSNVTTTAGTPSEQGGDTSPRNRIKNGKSCIPFLQDEDSKVLEFWQIWSESIPPSSDLTGGMSIDYRVATSADMQKLQWRVAGPQNIFIQKMVDFFWNVGAPESEIERLNDIGALINPVKIGSWIDMSSKGGMDGGWYFPVDISLQTALQASDVGDPTNKVTEWAENNSIVNCYTVGRDMGAAPPRQTELRIKLPGSDFTSQLRIATDAFFMFGFPSIPEDALKILRENETEGLCLSVITSSEGFVRLGLLIPKPSKEAVVAMYNLSGANQSNMNKFEESLGCDGPYQVEYQYLMKGFGYGVYKEGFDIVFHYCCEG